MTITHCAECHQPFPHREAARVCPDCHRLMRRAQKQWGDRWALEWRAHKERKLLAKAHEKLKPFPEQARREFLADLKRERLDRRVCFGTSNLASYRHTSEVDILSQMLLAKAYNALRFDLPCAWDSLEAIMALEVPLARFNDYVAQEMAERRRLGLVDFQPHADLTTLHSWDVEQYVLPMGLHGPSDADRGLALEVIYSRYLPSVQWAFSYRNGWVMSIPDGIAEDYVYEVKSCQEHTYPFTLQHIRHQAHLYAYFWQRPRVFYELIVGRKVHKGTSWSFRVTRIESQVEDADPKLAQALLRQVPSASPNRWQQGSLFGTG